jgi:hypothetical protein
MLFESLLDSVRAAPKPSCFSDSSFGEYKAYSFPPFSSTGAYSRRKELSLATLVRRLFSRLVRRFSILVRRLSEGEEGTCWGRCMSRLERLDCRRRGGGGGGAMELPVLSLETIRWEWRFDAIEEVRRMSATGEGDSEPSKVLRREDVALCPGVVVRIEPERCGSSVVDEFALEVLMSVSLAPCLERGGGGGDFATDEGSLMLGAEVVKELSTECWEEMVREELLRDLFPAVDVRS